MDPSSYLCSQLYSGKTSTLDLRAEHLCGQVPDGTHRVLAYTLLGSELPDLIVPIRVLRIHPLALAIANAFTMAVRLLQDPFRTPHFKTKRFKGSAFFIPMQNRDV